MGLQPFRILSLDGGGVTAVIAAAVLEAFEQSTARGIVENFDLITGTSTGGVIAIGLAMGVTAGEITRFFVKSGARIFPRRSAETFSGRVAQFFRPKITDAVRRNELVTLLGDRRLSEALTRLVIPSYDADEGRGYSCSKNAALRVPHPRRRPACRGRGTRDVVVALAVYDPPPRQVRRRRPLGQLPGFDRSRRGPRYPRPSPRAGPNVEPWHEQLRQPGRQTLSDYRGRSEARS